MLLTIYLSKCVVVDAESLTKQLSAKSSQLISLPDNPVDAIWDKRPPRPANKVFHLDEKYSGQSHSDKVTKIREELRKQKAKALVVTMLDEVAWLFNLRGSDIDFNPGVAPLSSVFPIRLSSRVLSSILLLCGCHFGRSGSLYSKHSTRRLGSR